MEIKLNNKIPARIKQVDSFRDFKRKLKFIFYFFIFLICHRAC